MVNYKQIIKDSFKEFLKTIKEREQKNDNIYTNIAITGGSWERWFQFELLSKLSEHPDIKKSGLTLGVEVGSERFDIAFYKEKKGKPETYHFIIELKSLANWQLKKCSDDIVKLKGFTKLEQNKFVLILSTFAIPSDNKKVNWIKKQIEKHPRIAFKNKTKFYKTLKEKIIGLSEEKKVESNLFKEITIQNEYFEKLRISALLIGNIK